MRHRRARGIVIAWMPVSQRSATLAERLGCELRLLGRTGFRRMWSAPFTYPLLILRTLDVLVTRKPGTIVVIAPPFIAPMVVLPMARMLGARMAVDIHSGALLDRRWRWSIPLLAWVSRRADAVIVTLASLARSLSHLGVRADVAPCPLPRLAVNGTSSQGSTPQRVVAICGWGDDEPLDAIAASAESRDWHLWITGRPRRRLIVADNVELTGFLDSDAFVRLVASADVVVAATTRDQTLLQAAWEAVSLERPLVLSDTLALKETFGEGPIYVSPDASSIAAGIDMALAQPEVMSRHMLALKHRFSAENDEALARVAARLGT